MRKVRRRRRASMRGWWRVMPFTVCAGATFFSFAWLHTQLLRNEYRAIELTREIQHVKDRMDELRGERHQLGRLERMQESAPQHALIEPRPGQVQVVRPTLDEVTKIAQAHKPVAKPERMTRSVVVILRRAGEPVPAEISVTSDTEMAHREASGTDAEAGNL